MKSGCFPHVSTIAVLLLALTAPVFAVDDVGAPFVKSEEPVKISHYINEVKSESFTALLAGTDRPKNLDMRGAGKDGTAKGRKSPLKAFAFSLILPGAGQAYTGSKTKALLFLGIEALSWTGHVVYHGKGEDNTDIYENYADENWIEQRYVNWLDKHWEVTDDELAIDNDGFPVFGHNLPDTRTQQYYEMIGKYNQFVYGWNDTDSSASTGDAHPGVYSPKRIYYEGLRNDANKMYNRASTALVVMMVNHVISAFEAALAARSYNKNANRMAQRVSLKAYAAKDDEAYYPMVKMTYKF